MTVSTTASSAPPRLSVVIPMFNEAANLPDLLGRLFPVLDALDFGYEVIAIDDGSTDDTSANLLAATRDRPSLRVVSLARNFGQHAAVTAGFEAARGDWIITLDADLQNPPEEIPHLIDAFEHGHDVVNTVRQGRRDVWFRRTASRLNGWLVQRLSGVRLNDFGCMLRGYDRRVVEAMTRRHEFRAFLPALAMLYARNPTEIPVRHSERGAGRSHYSVWKLLRLQLDLITTFSLAPLRALFTIGGAIAATSIAGGILLLVLRVIYGPGWASQGVFTLFAVLFMFVGLQFLAFGLLGEYIGRIYQEVRSRPSFIVREEWPSPEARDARAAAPQFDAGNVPGSRP